MSSIKKRVVVCFVLLVLSLVVAFNVQPAYTFVKEWRAERLRVQAQEAYANQDTDAALELLKSSYQLYSQNPETNRLIASIYDDVNPPMAAQFWQESYFLSKNPEDLFYWLQAALMWGDLKVLETHFHELEDEYSDILKVTYLKARWRFRANRIREALILLKKVIQNLNATPQMQLFYIQVTQYSGDPQIIAGGIEYLVQLSNRDDELGLFALRNLGNYPGLGDTDIVEIVRNLKKHPLKKREDDLLVLALEYQDFAERGEAQDANNIFDQAKTFYDLEDMAELTEFSRWLNQHHLHQKTLSLISEEKALLRKDLFLIWLDAMAVTEQWDGIQKVLSNHKVPLEEFFKSLFQARVFYEKHEMQLAENAWKKLALNSAENSEQLWFIIQYSQKLGLNEPARIAYQFLVRNPSFMRVAYEQWLLLEQEEKNTKEIQEILARMATVYPKDNAVKNDLAYVNLLLKENINEALSVSRELLQSKPSELTYRITYALANLRLGKDQEAMKWISGFEMDWSNIRSGWRAVVASIYRTNGKMNSANEVLYGINPATLLKEENALLKQ